MSSIRQIEANRLNALKSTGPRSEAGKDATRFNALKHGLDAVSVVIPGEEASGLDALAECYRVQFSPQTPAEGFLVDTLVQCDWLRRRLLRVEAELYRVLPARPDLINSLGYTWEKDASGAGILLKVARQLNALHRQYFRAFDELNRIVRRRGEPDPAPAQEQEPPAQPPQAPEPAIGFVPENPSSLAATAPLARASQWGGPPGPRTDAPVGPRP